MATVEFIQKRIEGKEKEVAKLEKKLARILEAQASNWEKNPYYYNESDIKWTTKDLESAKKSLDDYRQQLVVATEKENSRNIPAILEFLEQWKQRVKEFYNKSLEKYLVERAEYTAYEHEYVQWSNYESWKMRKENPEEVDRRHKEYKQRRREFNSKWNFIEAYVERKFNEETHKYDAFILNNEKLQKDLDKDADAKYDFIIERTNALIGTITDASGLYVGMKGDLNGYIIGERGTVKVETIGAGGYNIQCYHFRTLINKVKGGV